MCNLFIQFVLNKLLNKTVLNIFHLGRFFFLRFLTGYFLRICRSLSNIYRGFFCFFSGKSTVLDFQSFSPETEYRASTSSLTVTAKDGTMAEENSFVRVSRW